MNNPELGLCGWALAAWIAAGFVGCGFGFNNPVEKCDGTCAREGDSGPVLSDSAGSDWDAAVSGSGGATRDVGDASKGTGGAGRTDAFPSTGGAGGTDAPLGAGGTGGMDALSAMGGSGGTAAASGTGGAIGTDGGAAAGDAPTAPGDTRGADAPPDAPVGGSGGTGGTTATGGMTANGGTTSSGGTGTGGASGGAGGTAASGTATGGATATGGSTSTGGPPTAGATTTTGGMTASGGTTSAGGTTAAGGTIASGGTTSTGGTTTAGGTTASGGTTSAGGTTTAGGTTASGGTTSAGGTTTAGGTTASGGATWIEPPPSGGAPPARNANYQAVGYDELNNRLLFFGGEGTGGGSLNDTWVLAGADGTSGTPQWIQLATENTPAAHKRHAGAYDAVSNRLIVYGGCLGQCTPMDNGVYVLSNANGLGGTPVWQGLSPTGSPPTARDDHSAVYDPNSNRLVVFGGDNCCGGRFNDTWILTNANGLGGTPAWLELAPSGMLPPARAGHRAACDSANNRMIVFGGNAYGSYYNDTWVLANANGLGGTATWTQLAPTGPLPVSRSHFALVYDQSANRVVVFGGYGDSAPGLFNDVWLLANANGLGGAPTWGQVLTGANGPTPRTEALSGYNSASGRLIVFGGHDGTLPVSDLWVLPLSGY